MHTEGLSVRAALELNPQHPVFEGHFPGLPVVPGVCLMQMVKETLETILGKETRLVKASQMKFLAVVNSLEHKLIQLELKYGVNDEGMVTVAASIFTDATVHFKFQGMFV